MKLFFYKSILIFFLFLIGFHFSFNYIVKEVRSNIENNFSKEKIEDIKSKLRDEMEVAIKKDVFISKDDAELINKFFNKIKTDLNK
tara:strand:+ start:121 stop:378 length:258 start_codon:yes stop_codon:yes gene_type:complete